MVSEYQVKEACNLLGNPVTIITLYGPLDVKALDVQKTFEDEPGDVIVPVRLNKIVLQTNIVPCGTLDGIKQLPETLVSYCGEVDGEERTLGSDYTVLDAPPTHTRYGGTEEEIPELHNHVLGQVREFLEAAA